MAEITEKAILIIDTDQPVKSIKDLRNNVKGYTDQIVKAKNAGENYDESLKNLVKSTKALNDVKLQARASAQNFTQTLSQLTTVGNGVVSGFNAITSATALWGGENEALEKTLVKLQAGLALTQQLKAVTSGIRAANTAFKALNATVSASPLFLIATIIAGVGLALAAFISSADAAKKSVDAIKKSFDDFNKSVVDSEAAIDRQINALRRLGLSEDRLLDIRRGNLNQLKKEAENRLADLNREISYYETNLSQVGLRSNKYYQELIRQRKEYNTQIGALNEKLADNTIDFIVLVNTIAQRTIREGAAKRDAILAKDAADRKALREAELKEDQELEKAFVDSSLAYIQKVEDERIAALSPADRVKEIQDQIALLQEDAELAEAVINGINASREEQTIANQNYVASLERIAELESEMSSLNDAIQADIDAQDELNQKRQEWLDLLYGNEGLTAEQILVKETELQWEAANDITKSYDERIKGLNAWKKANGDLQKYRIKQEDQEKKRRENNLKETSRYLTEASKLFSDNTVAGKALGVASATIDTYVAANKALSTFPPPASYAAAAATIASGLASVKNILNTKVPGASDSSSSTQASIPLPTFPERDVSGYESYREVDAVNEIQFNQQPVLVVEDVDQVQDRVTTVREDVNV